MRRLSVITSCLFTLSGCATLSFAPPIVDMRDKLEARRNQTTFNAVCTPQYVTQNDHSVLIEPNVDGALALIDNFILTYRCQRDRASEGRQYFDLTRFVTLAGGAVASALGGPTTVAIATGAAGAAIGTGKGYYSPVEKSKVLNDGVRALLCIHNEAVGIDGPTLEVISQVQDNGTQGTKTTMPKTAAAIAAGQEVEPAVPVTSERQYYNMISTALWSVEQLMADRLRDFGQKFDMDGVQAELDKLKQEVKDKTDAAGTAEDRGAAITQAPKPAVVATSTQAAKFDDAQKQAQAIGARKIGMTMIQLDVLKPKLDQCIVKAKV